jgi:hypothetical protein
MALILQISEFVLPNDQWSVSTAVESCGNMIYFSNVWIRGSSWDDLAPKRVSMAINRVSSEE